MHVRTPRPLIAILLTTAALLPGTVARSADRDSLTIFGRVLDWGGKPIRQTWVIADGSRRMGTLVDPKGNYVLAIPGSTIPELARSPLKFRIQARHRGWRITLPSGETELGIELRVITDSSGASYFRVSSNRGEVATEVANAAVLNGNPRASIEIDFVGAPGDQPDSLAALQASEQVKLAGLAPSVVKDSEYSTALYLPRPVLSFAPLYESTPIETRHDHHAKTARVRPLRHVWVPPLSRLPRIVMADSTAMAASSPATSEAGEVSGSMTSPGSSSKPAPPMTPGAGITNETASKKTVTTPVAGIEPEASRAKPAPPMTPPMTPTASSTKPETAKSNPITSSGATPSASVTPPPAAASPVTNTAEDKKEKKRKEREGGSRVFHPGYSDEDDKGDHSRIVRPAVGNGTPSGDEGATREVRPAEPGSTTANGTPPPLTDQTISFATPEQLEAWAKRLAAGQNPPLPPGSTTASSNAAKGSPTSPPNATTMTPMVPNHTTAAPMTPPPSPDPPAKTPTSNGSSITGTPNGSTSWSAARPPATTTHSNAERHPAETAGAAPSPSTTVEPPSPTADDPDSTDLEMMAWSQTHGANESGANATAEDHRPATTASWPLPPAPTASSPTSPPAPSPNARAGGSNVSKPGQSPPPIQPRPALRAPGSRVTVIDPNVPLWQPAAPESCQCRIDGTIEVDSDEPLSERTRVVISLEDDPTNTTMVELFMGSPRAFQLRPVACGAHRLKYQILNRVKLTLVNPDLTVNCGTGGAQQVKLVLEPSGKRRSLR